MLTPLTDKILALSRSLSLSDAIYLDRGQETRCRLQQLELYIRRKRIKGTNSDEYGDLHIYPFQLLPSFSYTVFYRSSNTIKLVNQPFIAFVTPSTLQSQFSKYIYNFAQDVMETFRNIIWVHSPHCKSLTIFPTLWSPGNSIKIIKKKNSSQNSTLLKLYNYNSKISKIFQLISDLNYLMTL